MIDLNIVVNIHNILIEEYGGGTKGIRDINSLESAIARPFATFDLKELYPKPVDKAAAIFESIIINHPFVDGNKRISYVLMRNILLENNLDIEATEKEKYNLVIETSKGEIRFEQIREWLNKHIKPKTE